MIDNAIKNKQKENEDNLQKYSEYQENTEYWDKKISDYYKYKSEKPGMDLTDIDTYVYNALMNQNNISMSSAASVFQALIGFVLVLVSNAIIRKINPDEAMF